MAGARFGSGVRQGERVQSMLVAALLPSSRCATCPHQRSRFGGVGLCKAGKNIAVASSDVMFLLSELNNFGENWKVLTRARFIFLPLWHGCTAVALPSAESGL